MTELIFVGRSDDNLHLVFSDDDGNEFTAAIDDYLVRSLRPQEDAASAVTTLGISPRDIQTRIRRGESAATIAAEAGVSEERIDRYAGPVYTERWHMAQRARDVSIRRGDAALGDSVIAVLGVLGVDILAIEWDSYRRDDGRWNATVMWPSGDGSGSATWIYDPVGQTVVPLDDEAKWIFEESLSPGASESRDTRPAARVEARTEEPRPRLVAVPDSVMPEPPPYDVSIDELEPPAWAGPGHPTMPVSLDDEPSWDDILFGNKPTDV